MLVYIQILRFLAALAVVAFHVLGAPPKGFEVPDSALTFALSYGGRGVDLFFVISGFVIFYATHSSKLTPAEFLRRRVERIVPLYFFVIFTVTMLAITLPAIFGTPDWYTPRHILKSLAFISFTDGDMPVVYVGWSLEYEMYFYLATALLMALTREVWRNIVVMFSAVAILGQIPGVATALGHYAFFADSMILEFVLGVIVGWVFVNGRDPLADARCRGLCGRGGAGGRSLEPRHRVRRSRGLPGRGGGLGKPKAHRSVMAGACAGAARRCVVFDLSRTGGDGIAGKRGCRRLDPSDPAAAAAHCHKLHRRGARPRAQHFCGAAVAQTLPKSWRSAPETSSPDQ